MRRNTLTYIMGAIVTLLFPALLSSCNDDETFTTDGNALLAFSEDTIRFDTVFTGVISTTQRFQVYNRHDKGVRIARVELESKSTSGFLMNVDGQNGTTVSDVLVLHKDSVCVFVKVNLPENSSMEPTFVRDAIVFTLENGKQQRVILEASGQNMKAMKGEALKDNQTFTPDELPRVVYDSLVVEKDATLTISAGTTLYFHNGASLIVHGTLKIDGTQEKPVTLRGDRLDKMFDYLPYDRLENQWGGIQLTASCKGCTINHADIHSGNYGILCEGIEGNVSITNSIIHNVAGYGLYLQDAKALVANTQVSNTKDDCVSIYGGTADFIHCTIAQFYPWLADRGHALSVSNYLDDEEHLVESANFYNCFITGYANNEVYGNPGNLELNIHFHNCVLLTDTSDETYFSHCTEESKDSATYKTTNFKTIDTHAYIYDFHLDTLSVARGKGAYEYATLYPTDMNGIERGANPDAGCYQFKE